MWHKKKKHRMENIQNGDFGSIKIKENPTPEIEPERFHVREYRPRFARVTAYKLPEDSKIHCCDGTELQGQAGDFYICLDEVHEFVLTPFLFKKLFLLKTDENV
jgi:hypothetical protein